MTPQQRAEKIVNKRVQKRMDGIVAHLLSSAPAERELLLAGLLGLIAGIQGDSASSEVTEHGSSTGS
jgi:hypothetical protein